MIRQRTLSRIRRKQPFGPDRQVDDRAVVILPDDPALTDPFLLLSEDWFSSPGFDWHPHRGLETVTTVIDGVLEHGDNLGHAGTLEPGDVQWMTAGRGIIHREHAYRDEHVQTLQLWLNLPASRKLTESRYQDLLASKMPRVNAPGVVVDVHAGTIGDTAGAAATNSSVQGVVVTLDPLAAYDLPVPGDHRLFAVVLDGRALIGGHELTAGQIGWSDPIGGPAEASALHLAAPDGRSPARLMVYSGTPLQEPVVFGGAFVMNTKAEIAQAFRDFHAGAFGPVPRQARLDYDR